MNFDYGVGTYFHLGLFLALHCERDPFIRFEDCYGTFDCVVSNYHSNPLTEMGLSYLLHTKRDTPTGSFVSLRV